MMKVLYIGAALLSIVIGTLALAASESTSAMPDWSHPGNSAISIDREQREQIDALHGAYRAALAQLDWSIGENGHAPETMQKAKELRMALRAEIFDVVHRGGEIAGSASEGGCPYSGNSKPVRFVEGADTLYL